MRDFIFGLFVRWAILISLCLPTSLVWSDESSPPAYVPDSQKEMPWLFGLNRTYDEWFVHQKAVHVTDPYIWVYNESFARDFGMPDRWIDQGLIGADALAFRTQTSFPMCGWNGRKDACGATYRCALEMYFNRKTTLLPWDERRRWTDLQLSQTSVWMLGALRSVNRPNSEQIGVRSPFSDPDTGRELAWWYEDVTRDATGRTAIVSAYDRSIFEKYSLVVLDVSCTRGERSGLQLRPYSDPDFSKKPLIVIKFPLEWRKRIRPAIDEVMNRQSSLFQEKFKEVNQGK